MGFAMDGCIKDYTVKSYLSQDAEYMVLDDSEVLRLLKNPITETDVRVDLPYKEIHQARGFNIEKSTEIHRYLSTKKADGSE